MGKTRFCTVCRCRKDIEGGELLNKDYPDNSPWVCVGCLHEKVKRVEGRRKRGNLAYQLRTKYNLTLDQYDAIFTVQGEMCAICQTDFAGSHGWCVDHDHETGLVRGILCNRCNLMLGKYDNVELVKRLLDYLTIPPADSILGFNRAKDV